MNRSWKIGAGAWVLLAGMTGPAWAHGGEHHAAPKAGERVLRVTAEACVKVKADDRESCEQKAGPAAALVLVDDRGQVLVPELKPGQQSRSLLGPFVGQRVLVSGQIAKKGGVQTIALKELTAEHDHSAQHGGMVVMSGDTHLEVVALKTGEVRVYVTDDFRRAQPAQGLSGRVEIGPEVKKSNPAFALKPSADGAYLTAQTPAAASPFEATVWVALPKAPGYFVTLMLSPQDAGAAVVTAAATPQTNAQDITISVSGEYEPSQIVLKKGVPARLHFLRKSSSSCNAEVKIPGLGVDKQLAAMKETVVEVTPKASGTYDFTCGMGMMHGQIVVRD